MSVSLTPAEAEAKIQQIQEARGQAVQKLNQISDAQEQMLSANWQGGSASTYRQTSQAQREEFDEIIRSLDVTVEKARSTSGRSPTWTTAKDKENRHG
ncbi:WXG100 family type VII secretion target [Mycolicibacterium vaccae]|nr:WXG100 family type VII secretion target [Mycolicibacterium vaccae]